MLKWFYKGAVMNLEKFQRDLKTSYNTELNTLNLRVEDLFKHISSEWNIDTKDLSLSDIQTLSASILEHETKALLAQKEQIERKLDKKFHELQESKYTIFNAIEAQLSSDDKALSKLHQVKLQTIDLYDLLDELVESAIITALEKESDIVDTIEEVIKDITYEAIKEGSLDTIRIRKIRTRK